MRLLRFTPLLLLAFTCAVHAQVVILDNFGNAAPVATGSLLPAPPANSWVGNISQTATTLTVAGTARDNNGWGARNLSPINASTMTGITVVARVDAGNLAPSFVVELEDANLNTHTVSVSTSSFSTTTFTPVVISLGTFTSGFDAARITGWSMGGGTSGLSTFRMTFDTLSLTGGQPPKAPTVTTEPADRAVGIGTGTTFNVAANANNSGTLRYQWFKDGTKLDGQTQATLSLASLALAQAGLYRVDITNDAGTTPSRDARLTVFDARATHALAAGVVGYNPNGTVPLQITATVTFAGTASGLRWSLFIPTGWSFHSDNSTTAATRPAANSLGLPDPDPTDDIAGNLLEWTWTSVPPSPLTFTISLNVPVGTGGDRTLTGLATFTQGGVTGNLLVQPFKLPVRNALERHSADTNNDRRIGLAELTRVIELFNTRNGTTRTGAYDEDSTLSTEDGFVSAPTRANAPVTVLRRHSADYRTSAQLTTEADGRIDLEELLRIIQIYNVREGTVRTGAYNIVPVSGANPDGFSPGP